MVGHVAYLLPWDLALNTLYLRNSVLLTFAGTSGRGTVVEPVTK